MIKFLLILMVGIGLGYTYGYMHGAAGEQNVISSTLDKVGVHRGGRSAAAADAEAERQARADSARARSVIRPSL